MRWYSGGHVHGIGASNSRRVSIIALVIVIVWLSVDSSALQAGFSINGTVSLPDGNPAIRVIVRISGLSGLNREVRTDNQGRYDFQGIPAGRYRLTVTNPADPSQFTDAVEADTSRRLQLRLEMFNAFNHPQFDNMNTGLTWEIASNFSNYKERQQASITTLRNVRAGTNSPATGRIGRAVGEFNGQPGFVSPNRVIQIAAKIYF